MAALIAPEQTAAQHQSLLHFVGQAALSDERNHPYGPIEQCSPKRAAGYAHGLAIGYVLSSISFRAEARSIFPLSL